MPKFELLSPPVWLGQKPTHNCHDQVRPLECVLQVGRDPRPVMRAAYDCFRTAGVQPDTILQAAGPGEGSHDAFYALLYVGLWHEAHGNAEEAQAAISKAVKTQYARVSGDYMASLAEVHCQRRGWAV